MITPAISDGSTKATGEMPGKLFWHVFVPIVACAPISRTCELFQVRLACVGAVFLAAAFALGANWWLTHYLEPRAISDRSNKTRKDKLKEIGKGFGFRVLLPILLGFPILVGTSYWNTCTTIETLLPAAIILVAHLFIVEHHDWFDFFYFHLTPILLGLSILYLAAIFSISVLDGQAPSEQSSLALKHERQTQVKHAQPVSVLDAETPSHQSKDPNATAPVRNVRSPAPSRERSGNPPG